MTGVEDATEVLALGLLDLAGRAVEPVEHLVHRRFRRLAAGAAAAGLEDEGAPIGVVEEVDPADPGLRLVRRTASRVGLAAIAADRIHGPERARSQQGSLGTDRLELALRQGEALAELAEVERLL